MSGDPDQMAHSATPDLGLDYLPLSNKKTLGLYRLDDDIL